MTHLYLIRHGDATTTSTNPLEDPRLTTLGVAQAERLRDRLADTREIRADVLIASTMLRARQTAEIIAPALGLPILYDDDLQEWRFPQDETLNVDEYIEHFKTIPHEQKPFFQVIPGAESWVQFMLRACTSLNRLIQQYEGKTIVVVCHGGIIDASFHFFLRLSTLHLPPAYFDTHNTSITHWYSTTDQGDYPSGWMLERYNDTMHLRDLYSSLRIPWRELADSAAENI
ncbi:MAG TPA: histidine phosphatase family protein [Ktedonobacteraceae bacterium]|jgi:probable phosphoglycerate mutase|nr:histidine phosphatase family protein [Ktedonobacteraceae bacterium]